MFENYYNNPATMNSSSFLLFILFIFCTFCCVLYSFNIPEMFSNVGSYLFFCSIIIIGLSMVWSTNSIYSTSDNTNLPGLFDTSLQNNQQVATNNMMNPGYFRNLTNTLGTQMYNKAGNFGNYVYQKYLPLSNQMNRVSNG